MNSVNQTICPILVAEVELSQPLPDLEIAPRYRAVLILVRLHGVPVGTVELLNEENILRPEDYAGLIWQYHHNSINQHLQDDNLQPVTQLDKNGILSDSMPACQQQAQALLADAPTISVVICTHERPDSLEICLDSVLRLNYPRYDVVVVDNAPRTDATHQLVQTKYVDVEHLHYVREDNQGQCWARNRGAVAAKGEIIAYTDDDVVVDSEWLTGIIRGFQRADNVACVNGLVLPAEIETESQAWFEQAGGFNKGYIPGVYDLDANRPDRPFYPYSAGLFGTGANMAIRKSALEAVGMFDAALGAGTITTCGDDLAIYLQLLFAGYKLVYEPSALLYHFHRREYDALKKQIYNYGVGFSAFITKTLLDQPREIIPFVLRLPYGLYLLLSAGSMKNSKKKADYPRELQRLEYSGLLYGTYAYLKCKRATRPMLQTWSARLQHAQDEDHKEGD
jgi:O-antigen biosynthesis protein